MSNKDNIKHIKKSVFAFLCIFASIGIVALLGGMVFLGMRISDNRHNNAKTSTTEVVSLPTESSQDDVNELIINDNVKATANEQALPPENSAKAMPTATPEPIVVLPEEETLFKDDYLDIVYMGDSIFDFHREDGTSIPQKTSDLLGAHFINLAMGGTCAAIEGDNAWGDAEWSSTSGAGMAKAMAGKVDPHVFNDCVAKELVMKYQREFANTDIFVIEYGINDFMMNHPLDDMDNLGNPTTYQGGLTQMINACRAIAPKAKIVLCKPTYCEFWAPDGQYAGDYYSCKNKLEVTVFDYKGKIDCVDDPENGIWSFDPVVENGINLYNNVEYIEDGIHLTEAGRTRYAQMLSEFIYSNCCS